MQFIGRKKIEDTVKWKWLFSFTETRDAQNTPENLEIELNRRTGKQVSRVRLDFFASKEHDRCTTRRYAREDLPLKVRQSYMVTCSFLDKNVQSPQQRQGRALVLLLAWRWLIWNIAYFHEFKTTGKGWTELENVSLKSSGFSKT